MKVIWYEQYIDESRDVFILVDESHRTNFGLLATRMRKMLPNACYLGFTGTPLLEHKEPVLIVSHGGVYWVVQEILGLLIIDLGNSEPVFHQPPAHPAHPWGVYQLSNGGDL